MPISVIAFVLSIILIVLIFGGIMARSDQRFKLERERVRAEGSGSSLGTSELKALIQEAMDESIAPLEDRLERIELQMRQLPERSASSEAMRPEEREL